MWLVAEDPTNALRTSTKLKSPSSVIGPCDVVPSPTFITLTNSSSIFNKSSERTEDIPDKEMYVVADPTDPPLSNKLCAIPVYAIGDCTKSSIEITAFVFFLVISSLWAFPDPLLVNVTAMPDKAYSFLVDNLIVSFVIFIG